MNNIHWILLIFKYEIIININKYTYIFSVLYFYLFIVYIY